MRVLVFGHSGQVASELRSDTRVIASLGRAACDLTQPGAAEAAIALYGPDAVINAAAWTAVDEAETHEEAAFALNATAAGDIARACAGRGLPLVHLSTDYVFAGTGTAPWKPEAEPAPLGAYGRSKLAGEEQVRAAAGPHVILRTAWVFSAHGRSFVKTMLRLSETRDALDVVDDQIGGPTPADAIAQACLSIAEQLLGTPDKSGNKSGTYHFSGAPEVSWAGFAREIFAQAGKPVKITGIPGSAYPTPAQRPLNSRLDCRQTEAVFGLIRPDWHAGLRRALAGF
jgi:dTDP-4-dehydrorhamnose reductase